MSDTSEMTALRREPQISVVMSVYNGAAFVGEALESILAQTWSDFEFIIINDGATDASPTIVRDFACRDPRIHVYDRPNRGLTASLNDGLALARGKYIARMDADDISEKHRFAEQLAYLEAHSDCVAAGCYVKVIGANGVVRQDRILETEHNAIEEQLLMGRGDSIPHPGVMYRKEAVLRIGGYREQFRTAQDLDLYLRLAQIGKLTNVPRFLLRYRRHGETVGATNAKRQFSDVIQIVDDAYRARMLVNPGIAKARWRSKLLEQTSHRALAAAEAGHFGEAMMIAIRGCLWSPLEVRSWWSMGRVVKAALLTGRGAGI